jgi:N-acetylglucosamine-6-phosphate deacetylase
MSSITRRGGCRYLGVVESAYLIDDIVVEVIADGMHLPPELLQLIYKFKGADKICLATDAMRGAGMADGPSVIGNKDEGMECIIEDGIAKLPDRTAFAGSVATADRLVRTFVKQAGVSIVDSVKMMTETPAKALGLRNKGILKEGFDADIVVFDEDINIHTVMISGGIL